MDLNCREMGKQMKKIIENNKCTDDAHSEKCTCNVRGPEVDNWIKLTWK